MLMCLCVASSTTSGPHSSVQQENGGVFNDKVRESTGTGAEMFNICITHDTNLVYMFFGFTVHIHNMKLQLYSLGQ